MAVQSGDVIVLVPGLLGFGSFGPKGAPVISYFRHVQAELERVLQSELGLASLPRFHVHEPPPTGPLALRVASLAGALEQLLAESSPEARCHVIGHSTGGVDARLLVNLEYLPEGGPSRAEKERLRARIASVISIAAPQQGAAFAENFGPLVPFVIAGPVSNVLSGLYLLSILNAARAQHQTSDERYFAAAVAALIKSLVAPVAGSQQLLQLATVLDPEVAAQVERFLQQVVDDHRLIDDLRPDAMHTLNARVASGDTFPVRSIVTVSPPPIWSLEPARILYGAAYHWASPRAGRGSPFPRGEWLGPQPPGHDTPVANDGIVPSAAQRHEQRDGLPVSLLLGDHLDVVGHFAGVGETLFKSGADFTPARFSELWRLVARSL
jgi:triacylglycerol lipase